MSGALYEGGGGGAGGGVNIQASDTTYTSGTVVLSGSTNITVLTNGNTILLSGNDPAAAAGVSALQASNVTYTSGKVIFTGVGGGVTVSSNTGQRIDISVAAQTGTQFSGGISNIGNTAGDTGTVAGRVVLAGGNKITLSGSTNGASQTITVSAADQTVQTQNVVVPAASNTTYTSGTVVFSGGANVTVGTTAQTVTIAAANQTVQTQQNIQSIAASDTTYHTGQVQFTGSNMVTVKSSANQRVVIDATQTVQTQNLHNVTLSGNTAGVMAQISSGTLTLAGGNNITVSQNGNAVTISGANAAAGAAPAKPIHFFPEYPFASNITPATAVDKTPFYFPTEVDGKITLNKILFPMSKITQATSDAFSVHFGVYTISNGTRMDLLGSASDVFSGSNTASLSNKRWFCLTSPGTVAAISTLSEGNYIYGMYFSVAGGNTASMHYSIMGVQTQIQDFPGIVFPGSDQQSTNVSVPYLPFYGRHSVTLAGLPSSVAQSDIVALGAAGSQARLHPLLIIRSF